MAATEAYTERGLGGPAFRSRVNASDNARVSK